MSWVEEFYVNNSELYGSTIDASDWKEGERTGRAVLKILREKGAGKRVLDVPCGIGRVAIPLAELGADVTGLDLSLSYLKIARARAIKSGVQDELHFVLGRAERLDKIFAKKRNFVPFDSAISIRTILGYGSVRDDEIFLRAIWKVVTKKGIFLLTARRNKENLTSFPSQTAFQETDKIVVLQNNRYSKSQARLYTTWRFFRKGDQRNLIQVGNKIQTSLRLYSTEEILKLLKKTGWNVLEHGETILNRKVPISESSPSVFFLSSRA